MKQKIINIGNDVKTVLEIFCALFLWLILPDDNNCPFE